MADHYDCLHDGSPRPFERHCHRHAEKSRQFFTYWFNTNRRKYCEAVCLYSKRCVYNPCIWTFDSYSALWALYLKRTTRLTTSRNLGGFKCISPSEGQANLVDTRRLIRNHTMKNVISGLQTMEASNLVGSLGQRESKEFKWICTYHHNH